MPYFHDTKPLILGSEDSFLGLVQLCGWATLTLAGIVAAPVFGLVYMLVKFL